MILRSALAALLLLPAAALAQANTFELHLAGKNFGKDTFTLTPAKGGYKLTSNYRYAAVGNEGQFSTEYHADPDYTFVEAGINNIANVAHYSATVNKPRTELALATAQVGNQSTEIVDIAPDFLFLPDFDPAAAQLVLLHCVTHPAADNKYNVLVPQFGGGGGRRGGGASDASAPTGDVLPPGNHTYKAVWIKGRDLTGKLDGKPVTVHTYELAFGSFRWIFFADDANQLMQMNMSRLHASYIRTGFTLDPITK